MTDELCSKVHSLKIEKNYLENLLSGRKKAEIRINDRDYQLGDVLEFYDHTRALKQQDIPYVYFKITHIHSGLGMEGIYVVLSVEKVEKPV